MFLNDNLKIFSGTSNPALASEVCRYLGIPLGGAKIEKYPDGEKAVRVEDDVRGRDCFVVQSTCEPVDVHLIELLIFLDCLRRASASRITAVVPYFGYASLPPPAPTGCWPWTCMHTSSRGFSIYQSII